jgi:hypothetical protein
LVQISAGYNYSETEIFCFPGDYTDQVLLGYQPGQMVEPDGLRNVGLITAQPFDPADSPRELHHTLRFVECLKLLKYSVCLRNAQKLVSQPFDVTLQLIIPLLHGRSTRLPVHLILPNKLFYSFNNNRFDAIGRSVKRYASYIEMGHGITSGSNVNQNHTTKPYEGKFKSFRTSRLERELQMVQLSATTCSCIAILWVSLMSFAAITLCVASQ